MIWTDCHPPRSLATAWLDRKGVIPVPARRLASGAAAAAAALVLAAAPLAAQGVRGHALTTARYVEVRPLVQDSVPLELVTTAPDGSTTYQGRTVYCVSGVSCIYYNSADEQSATTLTQDLSVTAWGLGMQGLSATALLRARADVAGDFTWPRSDDAFDAILAYLELNRGVYRVRLGRQQTLSGLGFASYDGADVVVDPLTWLRVEGYGGRSLARGLYEPANEALRGVEDFVPDRTRWLLGGAAELRATPAAGLSVRYQREILADRSSLVSERGAIEGWAYLPLGASLTASMDYDFAFGEVGKARATLHAPVDHGRLAFDLTGRRYKPYFDLWTIWGFFSPVAYYEGELTGTWSVGRGVSVWGSAGLRSYQDAEAPVVFRPLEDHATRYGAGARWAPPGDWSVDGSYRLERGFGAALNNGEVSVRWSPRQDVSLTAYGTAFQQFEEFRVGEGAVWGAGLSGRAPLLYGSSVDAGAALYRNTFRNRPGATDWNQLRAWAGLTIPIGSDPGIVPAGGAR